MPHERYRSDEQEGDQPGAQDQPSVAQQKGEQADERKIVVGWKTVEGRGWD
jgi:hypothetical protein